METIVRVSPSTTHIVFLRGINVGGKNIIRMADLAACFEKLGFTDVETYIASGKYAEAVSRLKKAQAIEPLPIIEFNLGEAYRYWGYQTRDPKDAASRWKKAKTAYERYLAKGGSGGRADKARRAIAELKLELGEK